jgi:nucleotide-binding universal stress UspA family protein
MQPRFAHIAVPIDFSARNREALEVAFELASVNRARVSLLHVVETLGIDPDADIERFYDRLEQRARREFEPLRSRFVDAGISAHCTVLFGKRVPEIVRYIREHGVDLVIASSHPVDVLQPAHSLSTVSYQLSILAPCAVLLVKGIETPIEAAKRE